MAEENDAASKSEEATPRKLEEARRRGEVAKSIDVPAFASLAGAAGFLAVAGTWMAQSLAAQLRPLIAHPDQFDLSNGGGVGLMRQMLVAALPIIGGVMLAASLAGVGGNLIQHGFLFTAERMKPDLSRLSPAEGFKRLFGLDGLVQFLK